LIECGVHIHLVVLITKTKQSRS